MKELELQIEELNFTINSLKMDQEAHNEHYSIKISQNKSKISELEEKITYSTNFIQEQEIIVNNL